MHQIKQAHYVIPGGVFSHHFFLILCQSMSVKMFFPLFAESCLESILEVKCKRKEGKLRYRQLLLSMPFLSLK